MRRLLFCDHSYHRKTHSTDFFLDLLRKRYEIDIAWDESWHGRVGLSAYQINKKKYDVIVFFQTINPDLVPDIKCRNIVFVPMFDAIDVGKKGFLDQLQSVGILNFCRASFDAIAERHTDLLYAQYFPDPMDFLDFDEKGRGLFYWQRSSTIDWPMAMRIIDSDERMLPVHMHIASDPGSGWIKPNKEEEGRYSINYSRWLGTKESYLREVAGCEFYLAPRVKEGIGFSFLEAMAMGKVVIASNAPTMNEYIIDGENGFLFDCNNVQAVSIRDIARIRLTAKESVREGHIRWLRDVEKILDFIDRRATAIFTPVPCRRSSYQLWTLHILGILIDIKKFSVNCIKTAIKVVLPYALVLRFRKRSESRHISMEREGIVGILPYILGAKIDKRRKVMRNTNLGIRKNK